MRIVINAQLPPSLAALLLQHGHEAQHVGAIGLRDAADRAVWDYALQSGAAVLTKDEDFAVRRLRDSQGPVIVWLRVGNCSRAALVQWLVPLLPSIERLIADAELLIEVR